MFFTLLENLKRQEPKLIEDGVDIRVDFELSRSLRRGATTEVQNQGVDDTDIQRNNRWRKVESAGTKKPTFVMREHYTEVKQAVKALLRFSAAL